MRKWMAWLLAALMLMSTGAMAEGMVPESYQEGQPLPVYSAVHRSEEEAAFFDKAAPELFQEGEYTYQNGSKRSRYDIFTFEDQARLIVDNEYVCYQEYDGEFRMIYGDEPDKPSEPFPRPSFGTEVGRMAYDAMAKARYGEGEVPALEKRELAKITLAQADETVRGLLSAMGADGYELTLAVDMDADRIREMGQAYVAHHQTMYNVYDRYYDFSLATEADEGYFLQYTPFKNGVPVGDPDSIVEACAFVKQSGVVMFELRDFYAIGGEKYTPERLLTSEEIAACFERDNPRRIKDGFLAPELTSVKLMYCPMRAENKKDGMIMAPAWYVTYDFTDGSRRDGWAWYSALDGKLIMDCYS